MTQVYDLMERHSFHIVGARRLRVDHCLLRRPGATGPVRKVVSHEQALRQCSEYFSTHPEIQAMPMSNTAVAAETVANTEEEGVAAIASRACAELYGLEIVAEDIGNVQNNSTRFLCISRKPEIYPGARKMSVMFRLPHEPGTLSEILSRISAAGVNLTKLESRPIPGRDFEFRFFFDMEGDPRNPDIQRLISELESRTEHFVFLGAYDER